MQNQMQNHVWARLNVQEIVRLLREQNLKRWWVAEFSGIHKTTLRRWLHGEIERVSFTRALALARVLGVEVARIAQSDCG